MNRSIKKVAVLGSGVMGSRIACHFAGIGVQTLLLDIPAPSPPEGGIGKPADKNSIVNNALATALKSNPSPVFTKSVAKKITTGNFDDNMKDIANCDWIIEVVVERLDIKKQVYEKVEQFRKPGTLITSNTSGIPIHMLSEGRSEDFKKHFCGTHFFNPPRYLRLLEIIPTPSTDPAIVDFLMAYGDKYLGKQTVLCKDTPAFIANRIGVFSIMAILKIKDQLGLTIDEVETLTGPVIGRPKSATFRTADVVGIDTLVKVAKGVADNCPNDEAREIFAIPTWLQTMLDKNWLGDKTNQGFFLKTPPTPKGEKKILTLDLNTLEYVEKVKSKFATLEAAKPIEDLKQRIKALCAGTDKAGEFYRQFHYHLFSYIAHRIPEISDNIQSVDDGMMAGFGWEIGAFETWDALGVAKTTEAMKAAGFAVPAWIDEMLAKGVKTFYNIENNIKTCYSPSAGSHQIPSSGGEGAFIVMRNFSGSTVWKNSACRTYHLGDDVLGLEWYTKMGSIGGEVLEGIQKSIALAEEKYKGLVIANEGQNFSAGANVAMIFMMALEQDYDEIDMAISQFQQTIMRVRYSSIPVVVAPHGLALGGACEMSLHADKVIAAAETYTGLVEVGIGVIPGGAGTKEFVLRAADEMHDGEPETITLFSRFLNIATAKVATSAHEAFELGIYSKAKDQVAMNVNRRIADAKNAVIELYDAGYTMPVQRTDIKVLGKSGLGAMLAGINGMATGGYATAHDALVSKKLAYVMCGGDLSEPTLVSEQYLLNLEREAFLSLTGEKKTLERIQSVLKTGKPLRN
jgi:3-hydroxyacyl-CoA dehydrogenase